VLRCADGTDYTLCDTPGIIEGSHIGKGLGTQFLKHIERTKALIYVLDGTGQEDLTPYNILKMLKNEISLYNSSILSKPSIIVVA